MPFVLVRIIKTADGPMTESTTFGPFETGVEASQAAKTFSDRDGVVYKPRRIADTVDWRKREEALIEANPRLGLPAQWDIDPIPDHFLQRDEDGMVSYFATPADGERNRRTTQKPGRYLATFYPGLPEDRKAALVAIADPRGVYHIARTRKEVRRVYRVGPDSCMRGSKAYVRGEKRHSGYAIDVYSDGDLGVAYLKDEKEAITARVVCWPDKKEYGRVYGDANRLSALLANDGYKAVSLFDGARVSPTPVRIDGRELYLLPYFDNVASVVVSSLDPLEFRTSNTGDGARLVGVRGERHVNLCEIHAMCPLTKRLRPLSSFVEVKGYSFKIPQYTVDHHFVKTANGDMSYVEETIRVRYPDGKNKYHHNRDINVSVFMCSYSAEWNLRENMVQASDGRLVVQRYIREYERYICARK